MSLYIQQSLLGWDFVELNILVPKYRIHYKGKITLKVDLKDITGLSNALLKNNLKFSIFSWQKILLWIFHKVLQKSSNELFGQPNRPAFRDFPLWDNDDTIQPLDVGYRQGGDDLAWAALFSWGQILKTASGLKSWVHSTFIGVVEWVCHSWMGT